MGVGTIILCVIGGLLLTQLNVLAFLALRYLQTPWHYRLPEIIGGVEPEPEVEPQSIAEFMEQRARMRAAKEG